MAVIAEMPVYIFKWSPKKEMDRFHSHDHLELGYCISGSGSFYFGDKKYSATPGDVFVVNNLERHAAASDPVNTSDFYFIFFDPLVIEQVDPELLQPFIYRPDQFTNKIPAEESAAREIGSLISDIWREYTEKQVGYKGVMLGNLIQISGLLLRYYGRQASSKEWVYALNSYYRLKKALDFIKSRFRDPITLNDIADIISLSPSRTRHFFNEKMAEGYKEYLTRVRIGEAKKLLSTTNLSISRIMFESGYQSHAPFYRAFKNLTGISPIEYRKHQTKIALFENTQND